MKRTNTDWLWSLQVCDISNINLEANLKILVIGSGGREHAIVHKLSKSPHKPKIYAAPGNAGISHLATCVEIAVDDLEGLKYFALDEGIDLTIVGPELPLVMGIVDLFELEGLKIFGPNSKAAQFEGSKDFTKDFLIRHGIPTAKYETHTELEGALHALKRFDYPVVIKADGLAAGKGVIIAENEQDAAIALREIMDKRVFGSSGDKVVIEAFLKGIEASVLCFVDGESIMPMSPAQDYKKAYDGDIGPNTGGMGTYSPSRIIDATMMAYIQHHILNPFIRGIKADGIDFKGILFVGLMIDHDEVNVLEYNVRLGDPETEVTLPRMENDLIDVIEAVLENRLADVTLSWKKTHAVCVILASGGYPESYDKGCVIEGLDKVSTGSDELFVYHCGTRVKSNQVVTNGGRVLGVTGLGDTLEKARNLAYHGVQQLSFDRCMYRKDIGK